MAAICAFGHLHASLDTARNCPGWLHPEERVRWLAAHEEGPAARHGSAPDTSDPDKEPRQ